MTDIETKIVILAFAATLGYFLISTAGQLHAANERLAAVEARMGRVEAGSGSSTGRVVMTYPEDGWKITTTDDGFKIITPEVQP